MHACMHACMNVVVYAYAGEVIKLTQTQLDGRLNELVKSMNDTAKLFFVYIRDIVGQMHWSKIGLHRYSAHRIESVFVCLWYMVQVEKSYSFKLR